MKKSIDNVQVMDSIYESILPEFRHMIFDFDKDDVDEEVEDYKPNVKTIYSDNTGYTDQVSPGRMLEMVTNQKTRILCDTIYDIMKSTDRLKLSRLFIEQLTRKYDIPAGHLNFKISPCVMINTQSIYTIGSFKEFDIVFKMTLKYNDNICVNGHLSVPIRTKFDNTEYLDYGSANIELVSTVRLDDVKRWILSKRYTVYDIIKHYKMDETVLGLKAMV